MKKLVIGLAAGLCLLVAVPASALPMAPMPSTETAAADIVVVKGGHGGGRGHGLRGNRGRHLGWTIGRHRGWSHARRGRGW